jgi:hypothetical protein
MEKIWTGPVSIEEDCHRVIAEATLEAVETASKKRTAASLAFDISFGESKIK